MLTYDTPALRQTGRRNLTGQKTLPTIWGTYMKFVTKYQISAINSWFLDPSDSYFLFADLVGFYTHGTYMHIFRHIFLSNYWWQKSDIWSQDSYRYAILWEAFLDPSDSYFLFADLIFLLNFNSLNSDLKLNKMNCELMLTYDTPALRQTGRRNLTGQKTLPTIWGTYMKFVTKYYAILWEAFLDPSDSYFLFADLIFIHIEHTFCICPFLSAFFSATIDVFDKCISVIHLCSKMSILYETRWTVS
jgi:hypothetical protein